MIFKSFTNFKRLPYERHFSTIKILDSLGRMVKELRDTTKSNEKVAIIKKYPQVHDFLRFLATCGPLYITSHSLIKYERKVKEEREEEKEEGQQKEKEKERLSPPEFDTIEELMTALNNRTISGNMASLAVIKFISKYQDHRDLLIAILDRDLGIGMGLALFKKALTSGSPPEGTTTTRQTINNVDASLIPARHVVLSSSESGKKVFPTTSKSLPVALGYPLHHSSVKLDAYPDDYWLISRKLDGIRCLAHYERGSSNPVKMYTRAGNLLSHLPEIRSELNIISKSLTDMNPEMQSFYIDGELCVLEEGDNKNNSTSLIDHLTDDFRSALSIVLSKPSERERLDRSRLVFFAFDLIDQDSMPDSILSDRLGRLGKVVKDLNLSKVRLLNQFRTKDPFEFRRFLNESRVHNWEGLIIRRDCTFVGKRTKDIVKIKEFFEAEFPVIGHRIESMQVSSDGRHSREELLSAVKVDFSGTEVWVGSGFSLEERRRYAQRPELLEKAQVTVRYFQESSNKNNSKKSLRFPTIKAIFEEGPRMI